jgi:hypothetical protein
VSEHRTMRSRPEIFKRSDVREFKQEDSGTPKRVKVTVYLNPDDVVAIDEMQIAEFKKTGRKPEKSELVSRAVQMLKQSDSSGT